MFTDPTTHGATALAEAVRAAYRAGQNDYALEPLVAVDAEGAPLRADLGWGHGRLLLPPRGEGNPVDRGIYGAWI